MMMMMMMALSYNGNHSRNPSVQCQVCFKAAQTRPTTRAFLSSPILMTPVLSWLHDQDSTLRVHLWSIPKGTNWMDNVEWILIWILVLSCELAMNQKDISRKGGEHSTETNQHTHLPAIVGWESITFPHKPLTKRQDSNKVRLVIVQPDLVIPLINNTSYNMLYRITT